MAWRVLLWLYKSDLTAEPQGKEGAAGAVETSGIQGSAGAAETVRTLRSHRWTWTEGSEVAGESAGMDRSAVEKRGETAGPLPKLTSRNLTSQLWWRCPCGWRNGESNQVCGGGRASLGWGCGKSRPLPKKGTTAHSAQPVCAHARMHARYFPK